MERELDGEEFWLPSEFLTDDDLFADFSVKRTDDLSYRLGNSLGFNSELRSPVESVTGSTETESDEDEFVTYFAPGVTYYTVEDSKLPADDIGEGWKLFGSPQSTLSGHNPVWKRCSSHERASGIFSSPAIEDVFAAAGQVARTGNGEIRAAFYPTKSFSPPMEHSSPAVPLANLSMALRYHTNQKTQARLAYRQLQTKQFHEMTKHGVCQLENSCNHVPIRNRERSRGLSAAEWPSLRQSPSQMPPFPSSEMRAAFLGDNFVKKERSGTGVFLPRRYATNPPDTRRKTAGCSTFLLPEKVVHALNLNLDSLHATGSAQIRGATNVFNPEYDAVFKLRNSVMSAEQQRNLKPKPGVNQEFWLPQEWTY